MRDDGDRIERLERAVRERGAKAEALEARVQFLEEKVREMTEALGDLVVSHAMVERSAVLQTSLNEEFRRSLNDCRVLLHLDPLPGSSAGPDGPPSPSPEG